MRANPWRTASRSSMPYGELIRREKRGYAAEAGTMSQSLVISFAGLRGIWTDCGPIKADIGTDCYRFSDNRI